MSDEKDDVITPGNPEEWADIVERVDKPDKSQRYEQFLEKIMDMAEKLLSPSPANAMPMLPFRAIPMKPRPVRRTAFPQIRHFVGDSIGNAVDEANAWLKDQLAVGVGISDPIETSTGDFVITVHLSVDGDPEPGEQERYDRELEQYELAIKSPFSAQPIKATDGRTGTRIFDEDGSIIADVFDMPPIDDTAENGDAGSREQPKRG